MKTDLVRRSVAFLVVLAAVVLALPLIAAAQDPPGRVARFNFSEGSVSVRPNGTDDWIAADPNRPLTTGDGVWVGDSSQGEMHIGSTAVRTAADTGISFLNLNDQATQIQLAQGTLQVRLRHLYPGETFEVDTPDLAFTIVSPGLYTIGYAGDQDTTSITVRNGSGEVSGGGAAYDLGAGQFATVSGTDLSALQTQPLPPVDGFERWCAGRDALEARSVSARYISDEVIGYEDLDQYGSWRNDPDYGKVWVPSGVEAGWAPYHRGHWVNVAPWGWTWVDDMPWGFAPFHYGRWAYARGAWAWVPGSVAIVVGRPAVRPFYAPALVAFVGGGGFSVSLSIGGTAGVAWFPLGPADVWVPAYHCSPAYMTNVNVSNSTVIQRTQITNVYNTVIVKNVHVTNITYSNQRAPGAVMAVSRDAFVSGRPVTQAAVRISAQDIEHPRVAENKPIPPSEARAVPAAAKPAPTKPPASVANRPIVTKLQPSRQVVPLGHHEAIANSNLVKRAPAVTPKPAPPPGAARGVPANKPGPTGTPAKPSARPVAPPPMKPLEGRPEAKPPESRPEATPPENKPQQARPENKPPEARPETKPSASRPENKLPEARPENKPPAPRPQARPPESRPQTRPPEQPAPEQAKKPAPQETKKPAKPAPEKKTKKDNHPQ